MEASACLPAGQHTSDPDWLDASVAKGSNGEAKTDAVEIRK